MPESSRTRPRFYLALLAYAVIAILASFTLQGKFRVVVWIFLAGLAIKTWLASLQR